MPEPDQLHIAATGCCLMDYLYTRIDFENSVFTEALNRAAGDGGLRIGNLVFSEDFEAFCGEPFPQWLSRLTGGREPDAQNLGGPAIVALMHAAQMLGDQDVRYSLHAGHGDDASVTQIRDIISHTPIDMSAYRDVDGPTPSTVVLSDPSYYGGKGERTFINTIGAAGAYLPEMVDDTFFDADIRLFGATGLVPPLHDGFEDLLERGRRPGAVNLVGTVYDFRSEQRGPDRPWPLGDPVRSFPLIDLLVCDREEALRISGCADTTSAMTHFLDHGMGSVIVTHGAQALHLASNGGLFAEQAIMQLPVCQAVDHDLDAGGRQAGDTTGCGDNFLGGVLTSVAIQMLAGQRRDLNLTDACAWGAASGGFACFYPGGTFIEPEPGLKRRRVQSYYEAYCAQLSG